MFVIAIKMVFIVETIRLTKKKRKKTEHTRIVAQLCSSTSEIFTSVVVYSRTITEKKY